jgi:exonuclease SbcC
MRPVRLELKGFTAFREPQEIDFQGLDLFAIAGSTGSGKSSILDAVTYALFGYVERVGRQVGQLISQGQPRMAVTLEFATGDERYRVTRTTPTRGATRILLDRWEDGEWRQAGEGADRVREADAMIRRAIGLDYEAFTRSVLLPQGRFAEFLVGDAKDRRSILTELLGLELFERLAQRTGVLRRDATAVAEASQRLLETEYAGLTEEGVATAEGAAKTAAAREDALGSSEARVRQIAERWAKTEGELRDLASCADDARQGSEIARGTADAMRILAPELAEARDELRRSTKEATAAAKSAERAQATLAKAEGEWGRAEDLTALRVRAENLVALREEVEAAEEELKAARRAEPGLARALVEAERTLAARVADGEAAMEALEAARREVDETTHADLVAAVRAGIRVGDTCPVCGGTVTMLPKARAVRTLDRAKTLLARAEQKAVTSNEALLAARAARDAAEGETREREREVQRIDKELGKRRDDLAMLEAQLADAFGGRLPTDPVVSVDGRLGHLEGLRTAAEEGAAKVQTLRDTVLRVERQHGVLLARVGEARVRLEAVPVSRILERARAAGGEDLVLPGLPSIAALKDDAGALEAAADGLAEALERLVGDLEALAERRRAGEAEVLSEAREAVGGLVEPAGSLADLVEAVAEGRRAAAAERATAEMEAHRARERLVNAGKLVGEIAELRRRAERFDALAKELRADRIIAFLQLEALQILAAAGSEHLATLSGGRYRLRFDEDEFFVVDTWNGEETRSARTLSGGETFLASLGLALALSEQVGSLSVSERARLDSLFLDEGFGTLDPETLEVVVEAIEQLGGDGRMVGVITHVQELAIRLPARIDVEKSPRGSRLEIVT